MGLSRLDNFLKSSRGTILYVNPNDLDATDSIENQGNSLTRPFKTIQRALIESARFSYQKGLDNDRFGKTTVLIYPGEHVVDNRPGYIPDGLNNYRLRNGTTSNDLPAFDLNSNFDLSTPNNELFKLNSIHGGVIIPRGTSLVGLDLRKTKIRPKYVPNPTNTNIERSALFRVTGSCYFWQFSMFDADPNGKCYLDYTNNTFVPNFSHHKLTCFEYADGTNGVNINDTFQTFKTARTDLDMYYEKISLVYGQSSGRSIEPDYPSSSLDIQPKIDEYRIVGSTGKTVGISSIKAGDGTTATTSITVTTTESVTGLDVDTPFSVQGITASGYDGNFVVTEKLSNTQIIYTVQNSPTVALPPVSGATLALSSDTVTGSSPYIFNVSLRSVFGMCGLLADGKKSTGFRSMVVAQFTGIGLQKDNNAFVLYNNSSPKTGQYDDNTVAGNETISTNSRAVYKPDYRSFHIKVTNDSFIQAVSIFAIGFADHFVTENGGDISLTNSNSNFGANALFSKGFREKAFPQDDLGYITHIIPPKEIPLIESSIEFEKIDVNKTLTFVGVGSTGNLYLYGQTNVDVPPENVIEGYRVGAKVDDNLGVLVSYAGSVTEYSARVIMQGTDSTDGHFIKESSSEKSYEVGRTSGINSIGSNSAGGTANVLTFKSSHSFLNGESIRVISDNGQLPDGLNPNEVYYAITSGLTTNRNIKLAKTVNDAINGTPLPINEKGGLLKVYSRVSDKNSGDIGHPIQFDITNSQWYVKVATASTENTIFPSIVGLGSTALGESTSRTFIKRKKDTRNLTDILYRMRYVLPSDSNVVGRPPNDGFIVQESNTGIGATDTEIQTYFGSGSLGNINQQRNFSFIADATWDGTNVNIETELPHNLSIGSNVELVNIKSTANSTGVGNSGFNRNYEVAGISSAKNFFVGLTTDPGTFSNDTSARNTSLPYYKRKRYENTYYIYRNNTHQEYISGEQDGIYYLTLVNATNKPSVAPFTDQKFSQPVKELFPQTNRDNPVSDPDETTSFASSELIGEVVVDDVRNSLTKETITKMVRDNDVGVGITDIFSFSGVGHTVFTGIDHGYNKITRISVASSGAGYGSGTAGDIYNARLTSIGSSITGKNATAKITVDGSGGITAVKIMDGGSAYGIGNTLAVVGVTTTASFSQAVLTVNKIYNNVGEVVRIVGVTSDSYAAFNDLHRITKINTGDSNSFTVESTSNIGISTLSSIGASVCTDAYQYPTGNSIPLVSLSYDHTSGIATATTYNSHGLKVDNKIRLTGANEAIYNGDFVVTQNISNVQFSLNLGKGTTSPSMTGIAYAYREGITSNDGIITPDNENLNGRMIPSYAGISTTLSADVINATTDEINLVNISDLDLNIGDYLMIDDELVRIKTTTTGSNPLFVFRGILGTEPTTHTVNSVVRKVRVTPTEFRRHSIIRASGHTFEYVGYGPGNYSTALPDKQNRQITPEEELLAQSTKQDGGINFYTGMNDKGISYSGNKRLSTITGKEEIFDTPIQTITGEDIGSLPGLNVISPVEGLFSRSIRVEGGGDSKVSSEFNGPVIINNKLTVNSTKGFESNSLFLQGNATVSRNYTVGIATPTLAGNPGDVTYFANPSDGGYLGWVYTTDNNWRRFGNVSLSQDLEINTFDQVGIATTSPGDCTLKVGSGTTLFCVDGNGVGIGTTANNFKLHINGNTNIIGTCFATAFSGDGSQITNVNLSASGWTQLDNGLFNTNLNSVGIGTSVPRGTLEVGMVGIASTSLFVNGMGHFDGVTVNHLNVTGIATVTEFDLDSTAGRITAGIVTSSTINVGTSATTFFASGTDVGIGTASPRAKLDVEGHTQLKTYSENVEALTIAANSVTVDLSKAQSFTLTASSNVNQFVIQNPPTGSTSFTIKITQDSTGSRTVGIDTFKDNSGTTIPVYWPGGGVLPIVTPTADRTDIYSFRTFAGESITTAGLYGVVGGQNFA